jgi:DNA-binding MarR family transcriptional regulator
MSVLSEPDDRTLQMSQLAALTNASLSRLSHVITRLEKKGWVTRCPSAENGRITIARLTDEASPHWTPPRPATWRPCGNWCSTP